MKKLLLSAIFIFLIGCASTKIEIANVTNRETNTMDDVFKTIDEKIAHYGIHQVLVVFDIDNTILTMENMFGSDQWFSWQESMFFKDKEQCSKYCVGASFDDMLEVQGKLFAVSSMVKTENELEKKIQAIQDKGVKVILLTSRGSEFRNSTELALKKNGYNFQHSAIGSKDGYAATYIPYDINHLSNAGLNDYDKEVAKLGAARPVSYNNGVYMTAGQHKGVMLKTLLHKTNAKFKAIVFADDHKKHTDRMTDTFKNVNVDLTTFRYSKIDPIVKKFNDGKKDQVHAQWLKFKKVLDELFPTRKIN